MRHMIASGTIISILCSGCVSYSSKPEISDHPNPKTESSIKTFTLEYESQGGARRLENSLRGATEKIIPSAREISRQAKAETQSDLTINAFEFHTYEACTQDYLTGLSLGLIPSWCTRPILKVKFTHNHSNSTCKTKEYLISSTSVSHIILIPFSFFNPSNQTLEIYQSALKEFINHEKCVFP